MPSFAPDKASSTGVLSTLKQLDEQFREGELTKKGYCRMKWGVLQDHADASTAFLVNTLKQRPITSDFTEVELYDAMLPLLEMVAAKVTGELTAVNGGHPTKNGINGSQTPAGPVPSASGKDGDSPQGDVMEVEEATPKPAEQPPVAKILRKNRPGPLCSKVYKELPEPATGVDEQFKESGGIDHAAGTEMKDAPSSLNVSGPPRSGHESTGSCNPKPGPSNITKSNNLQPSGSKEVVGPCVVLKKRKTRADDDGHLVVDDSAPSSSAKKVKLEIDSDFESGDTSSIVQTNGSTSIKVDPDSGEDSAPRKTRRSIRVKADGDLDGDGRSKKSVKRRTAQIKHESDSDEDFEEKKPAVRRASKGPKASVKAEKKAGFERCRICRQKLDSPDLRRFEGHPNMAVEEVVAVSHEKFRDCYDELPDNKLTMFSIYDEEGHLCPLDGGVVERGEYLYASGYLKPIFEHDPSAEDAVPTKEIGPITQWWISGFDGGEKALLGISTGFGEYHLMEPAESYAPFMKVLLEKIYLGKLVIEFLIHEEASYEDLLNHIQTSVPPPGIPKITEESLFRHAQFVCDQVVSYDEAGYSSSEDEDNIDWRLLSNAPCMRTLKSLAGATTKKGGFNIVEKTRNKSLKPPKTKDGVTMATTTALVREIFDSLFDGQLAVDENKLQGRKKYRCGVCEFCQKPDCGSCTNCKNMLKFGGSGKSKQSCIKRKCPNMTEQEPVIESDEDEDANDDSGTVSSKARTKNREFLATKKKTTWIGEPIHIEDNGKTYYQSAMVGKDEIRIGDYISCQASEKNAPVVIGRVQFLWEKASQFNEKYMHLYWFARGCETILGETAHSQELFVVDECEDTLLNGVISKVTVHKKEVSPTWANDGGKEGYEQPTYGPSEFFYSKKYDTVRGRFETISTPDASTDKFKHKHCPACIAAKKQKEFETPCLSEPLEEVDGQTEFGLLTWRGEEYFKGQCVYLEPETFKFKKGSKFSKVTKKDDDDEKPSKILYDDEKYPEKYRKTDDRRPTNKDNPDPFCIGLIHGIYAKTGGLVSSQKVAIRVFKFYRPENTRGIVSDLRPLDLTKLYASVEDYVTIDFSRVVGKCYVVYDNNLPGGPSEATSWSTEGPDRFYFSDAFDPEELTTVDPPRVFSLLGNIGKGGGNNKGKKSTKHAVTIPSFPSIDRPLRCLDVFAGCGGLSDGLHQVGVADTNWAIEKLEEAASAFRLNNPGTTVFTDDCNHFLKAVINGEKRNNKGQKYPQKGEVEMLVGGPPCQGFSGMNRFNWRETAAFRNSLVVSYLSFCDYYRPKFFILENVRNFVSFKKSMVLKLTLRCLIEMGYQVAVGILQAGHYGVPQTRRRAIILAAAPGEILPQYPEPLHVFSPKAGGLSIAVDEKKIVSGSRFTESAPLRTITVYDALSDLPKIENGDQKVERPYGEPESLTHFQRMMRDKTAGAMLRDHICKEFSDLVLERIKYIPTTKNADWRDLPNIEVTLSDGTVIRKLVYTHVDKKNGNSPSGALRGVCSCATGGKCDPMDRQFFTLIPWCLPHTGNRHNHWAGLYGRLQWGEFFSTTVTNPEPMGKQGRVLHPVQNRCVSVRECARSQGFRDSYRFYGSPLDKHRQVGNAVPPPMGRAIGLEIKKSVVSKKTEQEDTKS